MLGADNEGMGEHAIQETKHLAIRIRSTAKEYYAWSVCLLDRKQAGKVEIGGNDDSAFASSDFQKLAIAGAGEPNGVSVNGVVPGGPKVRHSFGRHRHVDQELQPTSSILSSSARLAAYRKASSMSAGSR